MADRETFITDRPHEMDYPEHEKTYKLFLSLTKWGTISCLAVLVGMAVGLMAGGGFIGGIAVFLIILAIAYFAT